MVRGTFLEAVIFEQRLQCERGSRVGRGRSIAGKGNRDCKGPGGWSVSTAASGSHLQRPRSGDMEMQVPLAEVTAYGS